MARKNENKKIRFVVLGEDNCVIDEVASITRGVEAPDPAFDCEGQPTRWARICAAYRWDEPAMTGSSMIELPLRQLLDHGPVPLGVPSDEGPDHYYLSDLLARLDAETQEEILALPCWVSAEEAEDEDGEAIGFKPMENEYADWVFEFPYELAEALFSSEPELWDYIRSLQVADEE